MSIFFLLETAFTIWMLVDAIRRGVSYFWLAFIFFFQPIGPWVYFFAVKMQDFDASRVSQGLDNPRFKWLNKIVRGGPSLEQLRYNHRLNPCVNNKVLLAKALYDEKEYEEASSLFREAVNMDADDKEAAYGLALCEMKRDRPAEAIEILREVVRKSPSFHDYSAWADLGRALWMSGQREESLKTVEELARTSPTVLHQSMFAEYLLQVGRRDEAEQRLRVALEDFEHAPKFVKRANARQAAAAREMLRSLKSGG